MGLDRDELRRVCREMIEGNRDGKISLGTAAGIGQALASVVPGLLDELEAAGRARDGARAERDKLIEGCICEVNLPEDGGARRVWWWRHDGRSGFEAAKEAAIAAVRAAAGDGGASRGGGSRASDRGHHTGEE
jgi:hypothetical protein